MSPRNKAIYTVKLKDSLEKFNAVEIGRVREAWGFIQQNQL